MDRSSCEAHFARSSDRDREALISIANLRGHRLLPDDTIRLDLKFHDYTLAEAEAERLPTVLFTTADRDRDRVLDFVAKLPPMHWIIARDVVDALVHPESCSR